MARYINIMKNTWSRCVSKVNSICTKKARNDARRPHAPIPTVLYFSLIMLCVFLLSTHLTGGLFARYTTHRSGDDQARVASFNVEDSLTVVSDYIVVTLDTPGVAYNVPVQVHNKSEVAIKYTVRIENITKNLPVTIIPSSVLSLDPGESSTPVSIPVMLPEGISPAYAGKTDVLRVDILIEQID